MGKKEAPVPKVKVEKNVDTEAKPIFVRGILGIALLLVFGSIAYSTVIIFGGTDGWLPKILIAPAAAFDVFIAFVAFSKILK